MVVGLAFSTSASASGGSPSAYVANNTSNTVSVIDTAANTVTATIAGFGAPDAVAITPDGTTAYVLNHGFNTVNVIDTATNTVTATVGVGVGPAGVAVIPDQAPTASFTVTPAAAGLATSFDASASSAPVGTVASYAWNFGGGSTATTSRSVVIPFTNR